MVKTVLPVLKADFPSASRLSFFGFRTSLKAHSRRTCMGPERIGSDCLIALVCCVWGRFIFGFTTSRRPHQLGNGWETDWKSAESGISSGVVPASVPVFILRVPP